MKSALLVLLSLSFATPLFAGDEHLVPAGSLIQCVVAEPRISSKTTAIGDPVLCQMGHAERYGRSVMPYNSYLVGRFEDYKDPGHFVGKGWMELRFDHMVIEPNTVIPVDARVVDVPGYRVDNQGRILGKGHVVRDAVMWSIPILWPVDLLMLPMRGPRPTLKEETRLTLKVMNDIEIPATQQPERDPYGLIPRGGSSYNDQPPPPYDAPAQEPAPAPVAEDYGPPAQVAPPQPEYAYSTPPPPPVYSAPPPVYFGFSVAPPVGYGYAAPPVARYGYGAPMVRRYGYGAAPAGRYGYGAAPAARYGYGAAQQRGGFAMRQPGGAMMAMRGGGGLFRGGGGFRR